MKKIILNFIILLSLMLPLKVLGQNTINSKETIDTNKLSNITLNYNYENYEFNDIKVKIYFIASISNDFQYTLENDFKKYNINPNGIKDIEEWNILKNTLESYIIADNIKEKESYYIKNNKVEINDLKPGLYLIETDTIDNDSYTLSFNSFLINLPDLKEDGYWNHDVKVNPKPNIFTPKYEIITYSVTKEWQDNKNNRPNKIDIEIYKDGNIVYEEILSSDNNWKFEWDTEDDGSIWTVVERNVPKNYSVSIVTNDRNFIIINSDNTIEENPQTLDNINLYFYLLIISLASLILTILFLNKKKV